MNTSQTTFLITILLISSLLAPTHGLILNGHRIASVRINGVLFCSINGNLIGNSPPLPGAVVQLSCGTSCARATTDLGQAVTNPTGSFVVFVNILDAIIFDPSICFIKLNLPVATCAVLPPNGALTATLNLVNIVQTALGNIAYFSLTPFIHTIL